MIHATNSRRPRILKPQHPVRIVRPDQERRKWLITSLPAERIQVRRHWNKERAATEVCECEPACQSMREDYFTGALMFLPGDDPNEQVMEQVVLHLTEQTVRSCYTLLRMHRDDGDLAGVVACLQRVGGGSGRVSVVTCERAVLTDNRPRIDVAAVVQARLRLSTDFFGKKFDDDTDAPHINAVVPPARSRSDKPRIPKGKG
jgi:hypothetical protein